MRLGVMRKIERCPSPNSSRTSFVANCHLHRSHPSRDPTTNNTRYTTCRHKTYEDKILPIDDPSQLPTGNSRYGIPLPTPWQKRDQFCLPRTACGMGLGTQTGIRQRGRRNDPSPRPDRLREVHEAHDPEAGGRKSWGFPLPRQQGLYQWEVDSRGRPEEDPRRDGVQVRQPRVPQGPLPMGQRNRNGSLTGGCGLYCFGKAVCPVRLVEQMLPPPD